jgi:GR25 family glycosyltransferase involved in LPS biosynthesis
MNIVVISLKRAAERRNAIKAQLDKLGLDAFIMDAIDAKDLNESELNKSIYNPNGWRDGEKFKPGEIGCLLSHIKAINIAKDNNWDDVVILEDDVILSNDFIKGVNFCKKILPANWGHVYLGGYIYLASAPVFQPVVIPSTFKISGSYAYILRKTIYDKAINTLENSNLPVDDAFEKIIYVNRQINSYIFFPFLAYPDISYSYIWETGGDKQHPSIKYFKDKL